MSLLFGLMVKSNVMDVSVKFMAIAMFMMSTNKMIETQFIVSVICWQKTCKGSKYNHVSKREPSRISSDALIQAVNKGLTFVISYASIYEDDPKHERCQPASKRTKNYKLDDIPTTKWYSTQDMSPLPWWHNTSQ